MLHLAFHIGPSRYALRATDIDVVLPLVHLRPLAAGSESWAGMMEYADQPVPVVDVSVMAGEGPVRRSTSTRIILLDAGGAGGGGRVGLLVERAHETLHIDPQAFRALGLTMGFMPFVAGVASLPEGLVYLVDRARLLGTLTHIGAAAGPDARPA